MARITPAKEKALAALLCSRTRQEAAKAAGIDERTLRKYFKEEEFRQRYNEACSAIVSDAALQAKQDMGTALSVLREIMTNGKENSRNRIQASRSMVEYALRLTEHADILERLTELEQDDD